MLKNKIQNNFFLINNFINEEFQSRIIHFLNNHENWDNTFNSRKTLTFGAPYLYANGTTDFEEKEFPLIIEKIAILIQDLTNFKPNNCLVNYYKDNLSKMNFHTDDISQLKDDTHIIILSLNSERIIQFRNINNSRLKKNILLKKGSLFGMSKTSQNNWMHSIKKGIDTNNIPRISLTFRNLTSNQF